ncbi:efflux RND transporter periplasmic adaptor subunit [Microvirga arsenatis]|uniref:Efflux RND transporter periplasmic adaptor subunit n=1 Tax=Microvirga arsenatis TaxID=2692265 RepID=A0ABW9Z3N6_9HYPH|nr:efflux RND transporter periplasmic adaptor subunit [Microvirga arsenatis]NBJ13849.1 efflux RND transporter periplasmic adaptor subunit [Microvirga arsenatis]NBJ27309.1 efflux RND transporter periplasmic adaptor subunit [Microvirga arsenatis]
MEEFVLKTDHVCYKLARILGALALIGLAACQQQEALPDKPPALVHAQVVELTEYAPTVRLTGEIRARTESDLAFRGGGRITVRNVDVGDHVKADQVLARINPEEQEANVAAAQAAVRAAEAQLRQATSTFERQKTLLARGFTTRREYDAAEEALRTAQGSLETARAQLATAQDQQAQTVLRAGVSGIITERNAEVGQVVQAAQPVFSIAHDGPRDAVFDVQESVFLQEPGDNRVQINLVSDPDVTAVGMVREVSPTVDPTTGTVEVKVGIDNPPQAMTLGSAVTGEARFKPRSVIVLPWSAMFSQVGEPAVWVVDPQTRAVSLRPVTIDHYGSSNVVIRSGLQPGETVVTAGVQSLRPQQIVALAGGRAG